MEYENQTSLTEFVLVGFSIPSCLKEFLFILFLLIYLLTLTGNLLIFFVVVSNPHLHKPMYWFLCHLSCLDMTFSSVVVPTITAGFLKGRKIISFGGCVCQLFFFHFLGCTECFLYTLMAYDRFLAICKPLHYSTIMNHRACVFLAFGTWMGGCLHSMLETALVFRLPFGWQNQVNYIFCDIPAVLKLVSADTTLNELVTMVDVGLVATMCFLLILTSYIYIVSTILKINSAEGRQRAFSTCTAHVTLVMIFYVPVVFHYLRPGSQDPLDGVVAIFYTSLTPLLNPIVYTLRNQDVKVAVAKLCRKTS